MVELGQAQVLAKRQVEIPVLYRGHDLGIGLRADIIVAECLLLELKTVDEFAPGPSCSGDHLSQAAPSQERISHQFQQDVA
jgi:GxxExxY protein